MGCKILFFDYYVKKKMKSYSAFIFFFFLNKSIKISWVKNLNTINIYNIGVRA